MSSWRWAWAFSGSSPRSTGIMASSFMSKAGFLPFSLSSMYRRVLNSSSRSRAAVPMRVMGALDLDWP